MFFVELERFELSSKRGINLLSTCLSSPSFLCCDKTEATNHNLSPLISSVVRNIRQTISDITAPPYRSASKPQLRVMSRPNALRKD